MDPTSIKNKNKQKPPGVSEECAESLGGGFDGFRRMWIGSTLKLKGCGVGGAPVQPAFLEMTLECLFEQKSTLTLAGKLKSL